MFRVASVTLVLALSACDRCGAGPQPQAESPSLEAQRKPQRPPHPSPHLDSAMAFELVASSGGALLAWAPGPCADGIFVQRYAPDGEPLAEPTRLDGCGPLAPDKTQVLQLSAVADGGKLGLAWVVRNANEAQVLGSFGADSASAFAPTLLLGAAAPGDGEPADRSRLAIAGAENGQMRVTWRAPEGPCSSSAGPCARVLTNSHPPSQEAAARGGDAREIPDPCSPLLVGALWRRGVWYEAFCALSGPTGRAEQTTELYAIRPEIFYAEAFPTLAGCTPLGVAPAPRGVLLFGMCAGGLRAHSVGETRGDVIDNAVRDVRCENGRPSLEIHNGQGQSIAYKLDAPVGRLELWLSSSLAPSESRVAFTGRKLLIATAQGSRLKVQAWKCHGETLVSDSPTML